MPCFNLGPDETIEAFGRSLDRLTASLVERDLLLSTGPVGRRVRHEIMDTDDERDHEYFFLMNFRDREQCDRAVAYLQSAQTSVDEIHRSVYARVRDPVFICWQDLD